MFFGLKRNRYNVRGSLFCVDLIPIHTLISIFSHFYQEGNMPLDELLAIYRYEASAGSSLDSSSGDLTDELPDMTLDKVNVCCYLAI